jgi:hypothetical protein
MLLLVLLLLLLTLLLRGGGVRVALVVLVHRCRRRCDVTQ